MKTLLVLTCMVVVAACTSVHTSNPSLDNTWKEWKSRHEKQYSKEQEIYRRMVWEDNLSRIEKHNREYEEGKHSFTMGLNQFTDMTTNEFRLWMRGKNPYMTWEKNRQ
ncbi:protein CTLA-2-alpha-like isoform X2 [Erpetoichthys calabaricus]|nr:protein CTLA-2-alpha-like isoform X2 [Erpetoichthys calabaricus]